MKSLFVGFLIIGCILLVEAMNEKSKEIVKNFLKEYQKHQRIPCTLHFLDTVINFSDLSENENFQFKHGLSFGKLTSTCNILICTSKFSRSSESKKIDESMKNHMWIIDGQYSNKQLDWPVLEATAVGTLLRTVHSCGM